LASVLELCLPVRQLKATLALMPEPNIILFSELMNLFQMILQNSNKNFMSPNSLAIAIGPTIMLSFRIRNDQPRMSKEVPIANATLECIITNWPRIKPAIDYEKILKMNIVLLPEQSQSID